MGSLNWEDGSPSVGSVLGGLLTGLKAAPGQALDNMSKADAIAWNRRTKLANAEASDAADAAVPKAFVAPRAYTAADIATPAILDAPLTALKPPSSALETLTPGSDQIVDPVALRHAESQRNLAVKAMKATLLDKPELWGPQLGLASVASRGPGATATERTADTFLTTGRYPTAEERTAHNYAVYDANGPTGQVVSSLNNGVNDLSGKPIVLQSGQRLVATGAGEQDQKNILKDAATAQQEFFKIADRLVSKPETVTKEDIAQALRLRDAGWPQEVERFQHPTTGAIVYGTKYKTAPPTEGPGAALLQLLEGTTGARAAPADAAAAAARPAAPAATIQLGNDPLTGNPVTVPAPAATTAAATTPPPIVPVPAAGPRPLGTVGAAATSGDPAPVVNSYKAQPEVHTYSMAKSGYQGFLKNLPMDNQSSDLALIVGAAKILDPPSVVREGEVENVRMTGGVMDKFIGMMKGLKGESRLPPEIRMQLWNMVNAEMQGLTENVKPIYEQHAVQLKERQLNPATYLSPLIPLVPVDRTHINTRTGRTDNAATEKVTPVTVAPDTGPGGAGSTAASDAAKAALRAKLKAGGG